MLFQRQKKENHTSQMSLPKGGISNGEEPGCNAGNLVSIPGLGRLPGLRHSSPLQYSCLENPMDRADWWATVPGVAKSRKRQSD